MVRQSVLMAGLALAALLPRAAAAQTGCNPSLEDCGTMPEVLVSPDALTTDSSSIGITISWYDPQGASNTTRTVTVNGAPYAMTGWVHTPVSATQITSTGRLSIASASGTTATTQLVARITDPGGNVHDAAATYTYQPPAAAPRRVGPAVTLEHHVEGIRDTGLGSHALAYSVPAYVSLDQPRSVSVAYVSGQARPVGYVAVDVSNPAPDPAWRYSLAIRDANNVAVAQHRGETEAFYLTGSGRTVRLAALWDASGLATGDYRYNVAVRTYWSDTAFHETVVPIRMLIVNEAQSRFGAGWSLAGWQRLYPGRYGDGVMITDGNGTARFFTGVCAAGAARCTYQGPPGELTTLELVQNDGTPYYLRTYPDGSHVRFVHGGTYWVPAYEESRHGHRNTWTYVSTPGGSLPAALTDPAGKQIGFSYYGGGHLAEISTPDGRVSRFAYRGTDLFRITQPDGSFALDSTVSSSALITAWKDARGQRWTAAFKHFSLLQRVTGPAIGTAQHATTFVTPQEASLRFGAATTQATAVAVPSPAEAQASVSDPLGHERRYRIDRFGNTVWSRSPSGLVTNATYNANGLPLTRATASGQTREWTWSGRGELRELKEQGTSVYRAFYTRRFLPDSVQSGPQTTHYRYDAAGDVVRTWTGTLADDAARATTIAYIGGRVVSASGPDGIQKQVQYYQDGWYNVAGVSERTLVGETPQWVHTYFGYDGAGRMYSVGGPGGNTVSGFDALNRVTWRYVGSETNQITVAYGYTGPDLTSVWDQAGKEYRWAYDALGRVIRERFPDGKVRNYEYNRDGMLTRRTDRRTLSVSMTYDEEHRLHRRIERNSDTQSDTTHFSYGTYPGQVVARNAVGTDTLTSHYLYHDHLHRQVSVLGGRRYEIVHRIDDLTGVPGEISVDAFAGTALAWRGDIRPGLTFHDESNPSLSATATLTSMAGRRTSFSYDKAGRLVQTAYPNGLVRQHGYDTQQRPGITYFSNSQTLSNATGGYYLYDGAGRVQSRQSILGDTLREYTYDVQGNLTGVHASVAGTAIGAETFAWDRVHNLSGAGIHLQPSSNRYDTLGTWALAYDAEGNLIRRTASDGAQQNFEWNALGQLVRASSGGNWITYGYNGLGQRVYRRDELTGAVTYYLYHNGNLLAEVDGLGNPVRTYTYNGIDNPVSVTFGNPATGTSYYYVNEQPGHVAGLLDEAGTLVSRYRYRAFGAPDQGTSESPNAVQPLGYMGRERDPVTGIYYVRARWYHPSLGRFVSEDPIGLAGGINTYAYAGNDPVNMRDPSGLRAECGDGLYKMPNGRCGLALITVTCQQRRYDSNCDDPWWMKGIFDRWHTEFAVLDGYRPGDYITFGSTDFQRYVWTKQYNGRPESVQRQLRECVRHSGCVVPVLRAWENSYERESAMYHDRVNMSYCVGLTPNPPAGNFMENVWGELREMVIGEAAPGPGGVLIGPAMQSVENMAYRTSRCQGS